MFYVISKLMAFVADPLWWMVACMVIALFIRKRKVRNVIILAGVLIFLVFGNGPLLKKAQHKWIGTTPLHNDTIRVYDYAVVLGGFGSYQKSRQSIEFNEASDRFQEAVRLYRTGKVKKLIFSGDGTCQEEIHGSCNAFLDYCSQMGIPASDILLEKEAQNTWESVPYIRDLVFQGDSVHHCLLITSAIHMPRALGCFEKGGVKVTPWMVDFPSDPEIRLNNFWPGSVNFADWYWLLHEWIGYVVYRLRGYI